MPQDYRKVRIFIASPGDVAAERDRLRTVIEELDHTVGDPLGLVLRPLDWQDVSPRTGRPQQVIFNQLSPETWDIFVGILWHRFGTPSGASDPLTGKPFSAGTEEEFTLAHRLWKEQGQPQILIYRCTRPIPPDKLDPDQFAKVRTFFNAFSADGAHPGLVKSFKSTNDFERSVRRDLGNVLREMFGSAAKPEPRRSTPSDTTNSGSATQPEPPSTGPIATHGGATDAGVSQAEQISRLRELIKARRARLFQRELQAAKYGIGADPAITIEIDEIKPEIADLERQLKALGG